MEISKNMLFSSYINDMFNSTDCKNVLENMAKEGDK